MHRGRRHRDDVGADGGGGAHLLGHREGLLEQLVQQRAQGAGVLRHARRLLHLAEDLRLAQHHRIEPAGDAEHVAHGIAAGQGVQVGRDVPRRQLVILRQPVRRPLGRLGRAVQFGAVAGRQDGRLAHLPPARQFDQRLRQAQRIERHLLAHGKRRGMVVEAEGIKLHRKPFAAEFSKEIIALAFPAKALMQVKPGEESARLGGGPRLAWLPGAEPAWKGAYRFGFLPGEAGGT
jgi:hypothetical protein